MNDLDKARIWAGEIGRLEGLRPGPRAAVEVIQSLPDRWIDAEKVREALEGCDKMTYPYEVIEHIEKTLLTPPLPTLADMTPEERDTQKWMQAKVFPTASTLGIITGVDEYERSAIILFADGMAKNVPWEDITPLPDLPKLEWPGSHSDAITAESVEDVCNCRDCNSEESSLPRPEDVPSGEVWLVERHGNEYVGTRDSRDSTGYPWAASRMDGVTVASPADREITLISRLVPEVKP